MLADPVELPEGALESVDALLAGPMVLISCWRALALFCRGGREQNSKQTQASAPEERTVS